MSIVTVSDKGQVVIPANIRKLLGITPGCQLDFSLEGHAIKVEVKRQRLASTIDQGFGMLVAKAAGRGSLGDFDVAAAMRSAAHDRP
jgi:AbrB family looped-hinge helix DNA binding protein